ncbi:hypothetical protein [Streptomyces uncialis]|uniref:hypothetical protein n=1 Tax=Streptomyces uncialis TaxID=1048205 RepID=UPI0037AC2F70
MATHPHAPYAHAVMAALGDLHDPANSWTAYDSDNGEVMLMETVIRLDDDKTRQTGWTGGLFLFWSQVRGWEWAYETDDGRNSDPEPLITGPLVTDPAHIVRATHTLLSAHGHKQLPATGRERSHTGPVTLTPALKNATTSSDSYDPDLDRETAHELAAYAVAPGTTGSAPE